MMMSNARQQQLQRLEASKALTHQHQLSLPANSMCFCKEADSSFNSPADQQKTAKCQHNALCSGCNHDDLTRSYVNHNSKQDKMSPQTGYMMMMMMKLPILLCAEKPEA